MALVVNDRVKETSTTTGTGTLNLDGAVQDFESFVAGIGTTNETYYCIVNAGTGEFEVGRGTVTDAATDTLSRDTILSSSNSDAAVNFSAGTKDVFCTLPASKAVYLDANDNANFADNEKIQLGTGNDLQIYHDGTQSQIADVGTGSLKIRATNLEINNSADNQQIIQGIDGGAVNLFHNGAVKLGTTSTGIQTTGTLNVNGAYTLPTSDGSADQVLKTNGSGSVTFGSAGASEAFVMAMGMVL